MNDVERCTWNCMRHLMATLDPDREGWAIDAGVGHFDFYFEWMHQLGYPTLALDPVLSTSALEVAHRTGVTLLESAISDLTAIRTLYHSPERDLTSLEKMWGGMRVAGVADCVTLRFLIDRYAMQRITALKLDIEGAEPAVIATLPELAADQLPAIISFEWGGEHPAKTERGAWHPSQRQRVADSFTLLGDLGYARGLLIGSGDSFILRPIEAGITPPYFEPDDNWGNAILTRADAPVETLIEYAQADGGIDG